MNDLEDRLRTTGSALLGMRAALTAGEPWPLSTTYGTEPEADWGPRELLAHVNEMLPYWTEQLEMVLAGQPSEPVPFGRIATDQDRLSRIEHDRTRPADALLDGIRTGLDGVTRFIAGLSASDGERLGLHPTRGELTIRASVDRFLVGHLEEHVEQLRAILARQPAA